MDIQANEALKEAYLKRRGALRLKDARVGYAVAGVMVPLGFFLDYIVYKEFFWDLFLIRIVCTCILAALYFVGVLDKFRSLSRVIEIAWSLVISAAIALMIYLTDGIYSPYYAGLNLVILGVSLMLPLTVLEALIICGGTIALYLWSIMPTLNIGTSGIAFNNLFFLCMTSAISCVTSYFGEKQRFVEFRLRWELDERNRQLAELDRMKSDFYANISHELRTPLTLILAPVEDILAKDEVDKTSARKLSYVKDNTYRLLKLVNDLLDVLKLEEKKNLLEKQPVDINGILSNIVASMDAIAKRKVINLNYSHPNSELLLLGDASAMEKIFINLINNALKFTEAGGTVNIELRQDGEEVFIDVSDTGVGIAEEDLSNIFDRFSQVDSSATRKHQGTGLGLALVKELTELQDGTVSVRSKLGQGTTMSIRFSTSAVSDGQISNESVTYTDAPVGDKDGIDTLHRTASLSIAESVSEYETDSANHSDEPSDFSGGSLLIVEDEPDIRAYLVEILSEHYEIDTASTGAEGLEKIQSNKPDLVVLDLMLPEMDGLEVCGKVKADPACRHCKMMLLTARTDEKSKLSALKNGADDFLTKPFSTVEIKTRLKNLWENGKLERDIQARNEELVVAMNDLKSTQGQLIQSEKLNALGRLAAGLLHEVNNPLNFAFATFQLLEREPEIADSDSLNEMMVDIRVGLERIASIVKDLKTFAYPEKTDTEKIFVLSSAIDSAVRLTSSKMQNTKIQIDVDNTLTLRGSQSHIIQVFVNLFENAADAMSEYKTENQELHVFTTASDEHSNRIVVHVKDNGPGISEEKIALIFDPFYTTKDVGAGMGMGLSICHTIIQNHGGTFTVKSELGSYTDFQFDLKNEVDSNLDGASEINEVKEIPIA